MTGKHRASSPATFPRTLASSFALQWRRRYFLSNNARVEQNLAPEDIDITLTRTLATLATLVTVQFPEYHAIFAKEEGRQKLVRAWPDTAAAIGKIRDELGLEVLVHGNGTTRLQLDPVRASGLGANFAMLFSSELLGVYKPDRRAYEKALELVRVKPEEVAMVVAHTYDLRGVKAMGMKTVYIRRWTDDIDEDMEQVCSEFSVQEAVNLPGVNFSQRPMPRFVLI